MSYTMGRFLFACCLLLAGVVGYGAKNGFIRARATPLPDGIYIGTNGIVSSIDHGRATRITSQATNVTVITRSGVVATTEMRLP